MCNAWHSHQMQNLFMQLMELETLLRSTLKQEKSCAVGSCQKVSMMMIDDIIPVCVKSLAISSDGRCIVSGGSVDVVNKTKVQHVAICELETTSRAFKWNSGCILDVLDTPGSEGKAVVMTSPDCRFVFVSTDGKGIVKMQAKCPNRRDFLDI